MKSRGMPMYYKHEKGTMRYGYFESIANLGVTLELKEMGSKS